MKAHLLYRDRDFDWKWALQAAAAREAARTGRRHRGRNVDRHAGQPWNEAALRADLALDTLLEAMARGDDCIFEVARRTVLAGGENDLDTIAYRQSVLQDCLDHPAVVRALYAVAIEAIDKYGKHDLGSSLVRYPDWLLRHSIKLLESLLGSIRRVRKITDSQAEKFVSEGWTAVFSTLRDELSDEYLGQVEHHLAQLRFRDGVLLSARLDRANKGTGYLLHSVPRRTGQWLMRLFGTWLPWLFAGQPPAFGFSLHPRDQSGARALSELKNRGIGIAANVLGQSAEHLLGFFGMLQVELAFYVGCVNLHEDLAGKGQPLCLPSPASAEPRRLSFRGLYDPCLALTLNQRVVGNDLVADGKDLVIVTGANQGGKSTFLRSIGLAQLMMQCGMFVPAASFRSSLRGGLLTHFKREEDVGMKSGKLDEELGRMSEIVDHVTPHCMILFNESFAATNEREGSEIARQITAALLERRVAMMFVTHLYEFARGVFERKSENVLFLRAARQADGTRTFEMREQEPLQTSFGEDLYDAVFGAEPRHRADRPTARLPAR